MKSTTFSTLIEVFAGAAALLALMTPSIAFAEQGRTKEKNPVVSYKGDPKVCPPFVFEASKIKDVRSGLSIHDSDFIDFPPANSSDDELPLPPAGKTAHFADYDVGRGAFADLVRKRNWPKLFNRRNWPEPDDYGYVVRDKRWRRLNKQCPGILTGTAESPGATWAPDHFTLLKVDIDNDGENETVLQRMYVTHPLHPRLKSFGLTIYDVKACRARYGIWFEADFIGYDPPKVVRFKGRNYIVRGPDFREGPSSHDIYEVGPATPSHVRTRREKRLCSFRVPTALYGSDRRRVILKRIP